MKYVFVRGARQLVTMRGADGPRRGLAMREVFVIEDGSLLIADGLIHSAGPTRRIENLREARIAREIDASGCAVLPGFIDTHVNLTSGPARLGGTSGSAWLENATAQRLGEAARKYMRRLVQHGVVHMESRTASVKVLRVLAALRKEGAPVDARFVLDSASSGIDPRERRLSMAAEAAPSAAEALRVARGMGLRTRIESDGGGVREAIEGGADSIDGLVSMTALELELMAHSATIATLIPGRALQGSGVFPSARQWIDKGVAVALSTGFDNASCPSSSTPLTMALAVARMGLTPAEAIAAATINAACSAGLAHAAGSLTTGKRADLVILEAGDYREAAYHFGWSPVRIVIKGGEVVWDREARSEDGLKA